MKFAKLLGLSILAAALCGQAGAATVAISDPAVTYVSAGGSYTFNASGNSPTYYAIQVGNNAGDTPLFLSYAMPEASGFAVYVDDANTSAYDDYTGEVAALANPPGGPAGDGSGKLVAWSLQAGKQYILKVDPGKPAQVNVSTLSSVPLPGTFWLFGSALLGFLRFSSRRRV